ncbi:hypothetical protein PUN28_019706 [Cardiocondyla obscurior]|uniref:C3H1-type domain-containing protein n=1 Tax=Cardiocondyla obscurior TaxID=286306 RepID=A0AAW2EE27_9HYME
MSFYRSEQALPYKAPICEAFTKESCATWDCKKVHQFRYCYQYQNTVCNKNDCPYLHCTRVEQYDYIVSGIPTQRLKEEVARTLQNTNVCGDFKTRGCIRTS